MLEEIKALDESNGVNLTDFGKELCKLNLEPILASNLNNKSIFPIIAVLKTPLQI